MTAKPNGSPGPVGHAPTAQRLAMPGESSKAHPAPGGYYERPGQTPTPRLETWQDQHAAEVAAHDQHRRSMAAAHGLSTSEPWSVIENRAREDRIELETLRRGVAAFRACVEGRPEHVHTRPVCSTASCDNLPKRGNQCNRCYEAAQRGEG